MTYIVGISKLYVGMFAAGLMFLFIGFLLGAAFWWRFNTYVRSLLTVEEQWEIDSLPAADDVFDLTGLAAVVCLAVAVVVAVHAFLSVSIAAWAASAAACILGIVGLGLRRKRARAAEQRQAQVSS